MRDVIYWIWLAETFGPGFDCRPVVVKYGDLSEFFRNGASCLDELQRMGTLKLSAKQRERVLERFCDDALDDAKRIFDRARRLGLDIKVRVDDDYPARLKNVSNPPTLIYVKGRLPAVDELLTVGVVGSRKSCVGAEKRTETLCRELAERGAIVVSGLAQGIDTAAARAVCNIGRSTVAVVGSGLDIVYPAFNKELFGRIAETGAIISEYPPGSPPLAMHFPQRNRIISGMSSCVTVTEAGLKSGALITARDAKKQGREVFVLDCFDDRSCRGDFQGCRALVNAGAKKISGAADIFAYYETQGISYRSEKTWDDRYLAWNGTVDDELDNDEVRFSPESAKKPRKNDDIGEVFAHSIGIRVILPEDWPEAPQSAGDPKAKEFGKFLKKMKVKRGPFGSEELTFEDYFRDEDRTSEFYDLQEDETQSREKPVAKQSKERSRSAQASKKKEQAKAETKEEEEPQEIPREEFLPDLNDLSDMARAVLEAIGEVPQGMEELSAKLNLRIDKLSSALTELEINGFVRSLPGARYLLPKKGR